MQLLAVGGGFVSLFSSAQGTIITLFSVAAAIGVGFFVAVRNNYFINRSLNKLTNEILNINEEIKACTKESELRKLKEQKAQLEQKLHAKLKKTYSTIKFKRIRFNRFTNFIDKHAEKNPNFLNTLGNKAKNLRNLLDLFIADDASSKENEIVSSEIIEETQPVLKKKVEKAKSTEKNAKKTEDKSLSFDKVIYYNDGKKVEKVIKSFESDEREF